VPYDFDGLCILDETPFQFHHLMSYIVLILCPSKLEIDNILSSSCFDEVIGCFLYQEVFENNTTMTPSGNQA